MCKSTNLAHSEILAVGFTDGTVRVYKYPVVHERAEFIELKAHKGSVVSICITEDNQHLVTAGRDDCCIVAWRIEPAGTEEVFTEVDLENVSEDDN